LPSCSYSYSAKRYSYSFSAKRYSYSYSEECGTTKPVFDHEKLDVRRLASEYEYEYEYE
jgi:hypothetical protein